MLGIVMATRAKTYEVIEAIRFFVIAALSKRFNVMHVKCPPKFLFVNAAMLAGVAVTLARFASLRYPIGAIVINAATFPGGIVFTLSRTFKTAKLARQTCVPLKFFTAFRAIALALCIRILQLAKALNRTGFLRPTFEAGELLAAYRAILSNLFVGVGLTFRAAITGAKSLSLAVFFAVGEFFAAGFANSNSEFWLGRVVGFCTLAFPAIAIETRSSCAIFVKEFKRFVLLAFPAFFMSFGAWIHKKKVSYRLVDALVEGALLPIGDFVTLHDFAPTSKQYCTLDKLNYSTFEGV